MFGKHLLAILLVATVWHSTDAEYNVTAYCTLVKSGTKLPSVESCQNYYVCQKLGYSSESCGSSSSFNKDLQTCQLSSTSNCYFGLDNPCPTIQNGYAPQTGTCNGWIYCVSGKETGRGTCPSGLIFSNGECKYGVCTPGSTETDTDTTPICDIIPNTIYFGNTLNCADYQKCGTGDLPLSKGTCTSPLVFDVQLQTCNYNSATDCSRINGADIPGSSGTESCDLEDKGAVKADSSICSAYGQCDGTKYVTKSCITGYFWDEESKVCKPRQSATPIATCNRCEGSNEQFVNAVDPECLGYLVCSSGKKVGGGACDYGFFDEVSQACLLSDTGKDTYITNNGACKPIGGGITCTCAGRPVTECALADGCLCGIDETISTECVDCSSGTVSDDDGVCTLPVCDCDGLDAADCVLDVACKCGIDAGDATKCTDCTAGTVGDDDGVCTLPAPCICDDAGTTEVCEDETNSACNCGYENEVCVDCATNTCDDCFCREVVGVCTNVGLGDGACDCGLNDGACELCTSGVTAGDCN